jgi:inner membrane protein
MRSWPLRACSNRPVVDTVSQIALGAAVGVAVMGQRTALWKAAVWGAVAGTLPDLDVLVDYGNPVHNMVLHRGESHAPFWQTLFSLPLAWLVARLHGEQAQLKRWWLALWLALVTHPLLDAMTIYGTQLWLPLSNHPVGVGSLFIIDPLYTVPLLVGTGIALAKKTLAPNAWGLAISAAYIAWSVLAQQHVQAVARDALVAQGVRADQVLVTPTPFNTVAWRVVAMQPDHYLEGFYSLLDHQRTIHFDRFERSAALSKELASLDAVQRIAAFSKGFYALRQEGDKVLLSDLRMGQEPMYIFSFEVARTASPPKALPVPVQVGVRPDVGRALPWLWRRIRGEALPPPR